MRTAFLSSTLLLMGVSSALAACGGSSYNTQPASSGSDSTQSASSGDDSTQPEGSGGGGEAPIIDCTGSSDPSCTNHPAVTSTNCAEDGTCTVTPTESSGGSSEGSSGGSDGD